MKISSFPKPVKNILKPLGRALTKALTCVLPRRFLTFRGFFDIWQSHGVHIVPNHFYYPVPDTNKLDPALWQKPSAMPGVAQRIDQQCAMLKRFGERYRDELAAFPIEAPAEEHRYHYRNDMFGPGDADMLYCLIREHKPKRYVEIGSGYSTRMAVEAARRNRDEDGAPCEVTAIEPYPNDLLRKGFDGLSQLLDTPLQQQPLSVFESLEAGDILMIDSSHILAIGSDVQYEFLEILPRLAPGVLVHIHDIYLPFEYFERMIKFNHMFWTEQYLLQAFLAHNSSFEVVWMGHYHFKENAADLAEAFPHCTPELAWPTSFWIRRTA